MLPNVRSNERIVFGFQPGGVLWMVFRGGVLWARWFGTVGVVDWDDSYD